jgi:carbonic anhydrase
MPPNKMVFWFRLSGKHLYYTETMSDLNVLGAMKITYISIIVKSEMMQVSKNSTYYCFTVSDIDKTEWKLCKEQEWPAKNWRCTIKSMVTGKDIKGCMNDIEEDDDNSSWDEATIEPVIIIPLPSKYCNEGWNWQKNGNDWNCDCVEGKEQAPIDLPKPDNSIDSPVKPFFQYEEVSNIISVTAKDGQTTEEKTLQLEIVNGVMKIKHEKFGRLITIDRAVYQATEIVIHVPAEHTIEGKKYDMEIQIVHSGISKGDLSKQAVLCFLVEQRPGIYNKFIEDLDIFNLPNPIQKSKDIMKKLFIPRIFYRTEDEEAPIMKSFSFYTYQGSLTAPPCTENTIIYVASKPVLLGSTAITLFKEALRVPDLMDAKGNVIVSNWLPMNNRKIQPLNGRPVFHYDHEKYCSLDATFKKDNSRRGHYEKIAVGLTKYFYVNSDKPSGVPNAYVVSDKEAMGKPETFTNNP